MTAQTPEPIAPQLACHPAGWEETAANLLTAINGEIDDLAESGAAPNFRLRLIRERVDALAELLEVKPAPRPARPQQHYLFARFEAVRARRWRERLDLAVEIAVGAIAFPATLAGLLYIALWWAK